MAMAIGLVVTFALNAMLGLGAYWTARHGLRQPAGLARTLAAATLAWVWATVGLELTGAAGVLGRPALLLWAAAGLGIGLALRARRPEANPVEPDDPPGEPWAWESALALGLMLWAALFHGIQSLLWPVKVMSDGPIYHLYFAARWWREGNLGLIATPFGENAAPYFPAVGDLWFTWLMTGWGGDRLAKVGQAPFWAASGLAAYALARRLGAGSSSALMAVAWFLTSAPLLIFAVEANVDMIFVAGYLTAAYFFVRYALGDSRAETLGLGALAAGGALGSKSIGVVFVPVLLGLAALAVARVGRTWRGRAVHLALLLALPLATAGYWYGRSLLLTGNPLYPLHVTVGGKVWLAGWYDRLAMQTSPYYLPVADWRSLWDVVLAVLDPRLAPFWFAAVLGAWAVGMKKPGRDGAVWLCAGVAVLNVALYWLLIPYRTQQRFMLQALGLAVAPLARLFDRSRTLRVAALGLLGAHLATPQNWPFASGSAPWDLSPLIPDVRSGLFMMPQMALTTAGQESWRGIVGLGAIVALGVGSVATAWVWSRRDRRSGLRGWIGPGLAALFLFGLACGLFYPYGLDPRRRFYPVFPDYYRGWLDLEARLGGGGARIAYAGTNLPFYLMGPELRNEVRYVNVDGKRSWLLHDYHREAVARGEPTWPDSRPGWDRLHPDYHAWLDALHADDVQILVVARANPAEGRHLIADAQEFPIERVWADAHPESFTPLYGEAQGDPRMRIYRVTPAQGSRPGG